MPSYYSITVSRNGHFYFRTRDEHCTQSTAQGIAKTIAERFPATEGFHVELVYWDCAGNHIGF